MNDDRILLYLAGGVAGLLALSAYLKSRKSVPAPAPAFRASTGQWLRGATEGGMRANRTRVGLRALAHDIGGDTRALKLPAALRMQLPWMQPYAPIAFLTGESPRSWINDYIAAETSRARSLLDADFRLAANATRPALVPLSTYRSFDQQADIVAGFLKQLVPAVNPLDAGSIRSGLVQCLQTRMLPGFSRHHWGSEVDVLSNIQDTWLSAADRKAKLGSGESAQMTDGPNVEYIEPLTLLAPARGLFYPYKAGAFPEPNRPHLEPEPWHFSLAHVSVPLKQQWLRQIGSVPSELSALLDRSARAIATRAGLDVARTRSALGMIDLVSYVRNTAPAPRMALEAVV